MTTIVHERTPRALKLEVRCRNCAFFTRIGHKAYDNAPCSTQGTQPMAKVCRYFKPDPFALSKNANGVVITSAIAQLLPKLRNDQLALVASIFNEEKINRRNGFFYGQRIYVQVRATPYLSSWERGTVFAVDADYVYVEGDSGFTASFTRNSIRTEDGFLKLKAVYEKRGSIRDPALLHSPVKKKSKKAATSKAKPKSKKSDGTRSVSLR